MLVSVWIWGTVWSLCLISACWMSWCSFWSDLECCKNPFASRVLGHAVTDVEFHSGSTSRAFGANQQALCVRNVGTGCRAHETRRDAKHNRERELQARSLPRKPKAAGACTAAPCKR